MVVPGMGSLFSKPGSPPRGDGHAMEVGVTGDTLDLPLLLSEGLFLVRDSNEFLSMAAEVKFSNNEDPELAMALAKKGGKLGKLGKLGGLNIAPGLLVGAEEGPGAPASIGLGNFCC